MKKLITLTATFLFAISIFAQTVQGDGLLEVVGSRIDAPSVQQFFKNYDVKNTTGVKYSTSKFGIDMSAKNDTLISMDIYRGNASYGTYNNQLPKGIGFGMNAADVAAKLGKPTTTYTNSGYSEYTVGTHIVTCWFENGTLNQVSISLK